MRVRDRGRGDGGAGARARHRAARRRGGDHRARRPRTGGSPGRSCCPSRRTTRSTRSACWRRSGPQGIDVPPHPQRPAGGHLGRAPDGARGAARGRRDPLGARAGRPAARGRPRRRRARPRTARASATCPPTWWSAPTAPARGCASWRASRPRPGSPTRPSSRSAARVPGPEPFSIAFLSDGRQVTLLNWSGGSAGGWQIDRVPGRRRGGARPGPRRLPRGLRAAAARRPRGRSRRSRSVDQLGYREVTEVRCEEWWRRASPWSARPCTR